EILHPHLRTGYLDEGRVLQGLAADQARQGTDHTARCDAARLEMDRLAGARQGKHAEHAAQGEVEGAGVDGAVELATHGPAVDGDARRRGAKELVAVREPARRHQLVRACTSEQEGEYSAAGDPHDGAAPGAL